MNSFCSYSFTRKTYNDQLDIIDSQHNSYTIFGSDHMVLIITTRTSRAIEESDTYSIKTS